MQSHSKLLGISASTYKFGGGYNSARNTSVYNVLGVLVFLFLPPLKTFFTSFVQFD